MEYTVDYSIGESPTNAKQTEITTYMWPGFLAELCDGELTVWELYSPTTWQLRPDITAPPANCIAITSSQALHWGQGQERWVGLLSGLHQRVLQPLQGLEKETAQKPELPEKQRPSLLALCTIGKS